MQGKPAPAIRRPAFLDDFVRDLRFAARALRRSPAFTFAAVSTLALGLALVASTMAVFNAYLVRSLPYPAASRLYHVVYAPPGQREPEGLSSLDWRSLADIIEVADMSAGTRFFLTDGAYPQEALGVLAAPGSLDALGIRVVAGRSLLPDDFDPGAEQVALIGQSLWRDRFGSDSAIIGRTFRADRASRADAPETYRIVGLLAPELRDVHAYGRGVAEIVAPLRTPLRTYLVRLRDGVPVPAAERRITEAARAIGSAFPAGWSGVRLESVQERYAGDLEPILTAVTVASGLVLLIVCANVAVLTLLRALRRQTDVAVRVALGAGRSHITRMLVAETGLICLAALGAGLTLTVATLRVLAPVIEERLGRPVPGGSSRIAVDPTILVLVGSAALLIALSLACVPLLAPWHRRLADTLRRGGRGSTDGPALRRVRFSLVAVEIGTSFALVVGCTLMIRSVAHLVRTDLGFETAGILRSRIALPERQYADAPAMMAFYDRLAERLSSESRSPFALTNFPPFVETPKQSVEVAESGDAGRPVGVLAVSPGYFVLLGIDVRQGRAFTAADRLGAEPVAVISETLARQLWPGGNAIGRRIRAGEQPVAGAPPGAWRTVVGVARDVRQAYVDDDLRDIYLPFAQAPSRYAPLYLRTAGHDAFPIARLRATVGEVEPEVLVGEANSLEADAARQLAHPRFLASLLTGLAAFATLLGLLGINGVTAYAVRQREREIAIRMALGATGSGIMRLFLAEGGLVLAAGLVLGALGALAMGRMLASQVYGVPPFDVATLSASVVLMAAAGVLATWWPARRAAATNPTVTLNDG